MTVFPRSASPVRNQSNICNASVFDDFDYVALGHIHSPQSVGRETVRYCGTPLKYSFSEAEQEWRALGRAADGR